MPCLPSCAIWPAAGEAQLLRYWVVTEHGATFAPRPGVEALRPTQHTQVDGLILAGDWTDTGWPATMEGAVRSGYLAAQNILEVLDRPTRLVRPGLASGVLARWLFGTANPNSPPIGTRGGGGAHYRAEAERTNGETKACAEDRRRMCSGT